MRPFRRARALLPLMYAGAALAGCATPPASQTPAYRTPPPYRLLDVDRAMSCEAITASFVDAARRAARLEDWLRVGPLPGYGLDRFEVDAPRQLRDEEGRLDALNDLQREKGCPVLDAVAAVARERARLGAPATPVLSRRG